MVSRMRTGILSDEMSIKLFPLEQSISLKQAYLAPRVGDKIFIPKKAKWMIKNLNLPYEQEQHVLKEFLRKSQMQEISFCCGKNKINTHSLETFALGRSTTSRVNVSQETMNALIESLNNTTTTSAGAGTSAGEGTSAGAGTSYVYESPPASQPDSSDEESNRQLRHELTRRRGHGQNWHDNPEVFEPRENLNVAIPETRREVIRITPASPLRNTPPQRRSGIFNQIDNIKNRLRSNSNYRP